MFHMPNQAIRCGLVPHSAKQSDWHKAPLHFATAAQFFPDTFALLLAIKNKTQHLLHLNLQQKSLAA